MSDEPADTSLENQTWTPSLPSVEEPATDVASQPAHHEAAPCDPQAYLPQSPIYLGSPSTCRDSSNAETLTDVQEYDDQGRLRKRTITRQSSGSSLNSSSTAYSRSYSLFPRTSLVRPEPVNLRKLAGNSDAFCGPHQILERPPSYNPAGFERNLPVLSATLSVDERVDLFHRLNKCLCKTAFDFVAKWQLPIPLEPDRKPVSTSEDREWLEWIDLLKALSRSKSISPRALHGRRINDLDCVLERAQIPVSATRSGLIWPADDRYILQLISASTQVAYLLQDALALGEFDSMYDKTELLMQERRKATELAEVRARGTSLRARLNGYLGNAKRQSMIEQLSSG